MFNTLYKKNSKGTIQTWKVSVEDATITTEYGELGGKIQSTSKTIKSGKNIGKVNETTPESQALAEAKSMYEKQIKAGYIDDLGKAESGEVDVSVIKGGVLPMLAHKYADHSAKIGFPCAGQPKLDGIRCVAMKENGQFTLWTRTRKRINSIPHIVDALNVCFKDFPNGYFLDGELYNHAYKDNFETIVSAVRKDTPSEDSGKIQYHIYDCGLEGTFEERFFALGCYDLTKDGTDCLFRVDTTLIPIPEEVGYWENLALESGYEGLMLRNLNSPYVNKRSYDLQKVVQFNSEEFEIIGLKEGVGKLEGLVGAFMLKTEDGKEFEAAPTGDQEATRDILRNPEGVIGKMATVKFRGWTSANKVPRFPKLITIRDYE